MGLPRDRSQTYRDLITQLLDRSYEQTVSPVLRAITRNGEGALSVSLEALDQEAARLAELGERLTPDNPVLRSVLRDLDQALARNAALMDAAAADIQSTGIDAAGEMVRETAIPGISDQMLGRVGVEWVRPDPVAIAQVVDYTGNPLWTEKLGNYRDGTLQVARNQAIRGMVHGWGPIRTARAVRQAGVDLPVSYANTMMRTLQVTTYRDAGVAHRVANAAILTEQIRIATLDDKTCLACIALHGTRLPIHRRIDDHHNGRCDSISVVRGRPRTVASGESWFVAQPEERQRRIMGPANYAAWRDGAVTLNNFVRPYEDDLFGAMVAENSLLGILGPGAQAYYQQ